MIVSMHIATGAAAGALVRSRTAAVVLGATLHFLADRVPHEDMRSRRFETWCAVAGGLARAAARGPRSPVTLGALASTVPDLEHVVRLPRPGGRKLFPSHRIPAWHRPGGLSANAQLFLAGILFGSVLRARRSR